MKIFFNLRVFNDLAVRVALEKARKTEFLSPVGTTRGGVHTHVTN